MKSTILHLNTSEKIIDRQMTEKQDYEITFREIDDVLDKRFDRSGREKLKAKIKQSRVKEKPLRESLVKKKEIAHPINGKCRYMGKTMISRGPMKPTT